MPILQLDDIFSLGVDVLGTTRDEKGTILAQTGDVVAAEVVSDAVEWWQHAGFASRPAKAVEGASACQAVTISTGSNDIAIASRDIRGQAVYGLLKEGETALYAGGADGTGQAAILLKGDGSTTILTSTDNTAAGDGVYLKVAKDKLQFVAPWGSMTFDATGFHIKTATGARFDLGALSAPAPLDTLVPSYCKITAGTVTLAGSLATTLDSPLVALGKNATQPLIAQIAPNALPPLAPVATVLSAAPGVPVAGITATTKVLVAA